LHELFVIVPASSPQTQTDWRDLAGTLATAAGGLAVRGWTPATAGNFSARVDSNTVAITISGRDKGRMTAADFLRVDLDGVVVEGEGRPSAETPLHLQLYRRARATGAVLHTHSHNQTVAGRALAREGAIVFEGYELLKAFAGVTSHEGSVALPVFPNTQQMATLVEQVDDYMAAGHAVYGYLIEGHGIYAWGADVAEAVRHLEAFDFLLGCELALRRLEK
jgi:methylthioribulose-1-phosphate dehydratase